MIYFVYTLNQCRYKKLNENNIYEYKSDTNKDVSLILKMCYLDKIYKIKKRKKINYIK